MLIIQRYVDERILMRMPDPNGGPDLEAWICLTKTGKNHATIGIEAPRNIRVLREELVNRKDSTDAQRIGPTQ